MISITGMTTIVGQRKKELTPIRVGSTIGHAHNANGIMFEFQCCLFILEKTIVNTVTSFSINIPSLKTKILDESMKCRSFIVQGIAPLVLCALTKQFEIFHCFWAFMSIQLDVYSTRFDSIRRINTWFAFAGPATIALKRLYQEISLVWREQ